MAERVRRSWVEVSRAQIAANYRAVRAAAGEGVEVLGVVKADAYGHGAVEVSRVLVGEGARWLAVSSAGEGVALRRAGIEARILVMGGFFPGDVDALEAHALTPVVHSLEQIPVLARRSVRFHLKADTGMNRLGTNAPLEAVRLALAEAGAKCEGLMTHFASAASPDSAQTVRQMALFDELRRVLPQLEYVHAAGTNAIVHGHRAPGQNMVRPGHAIYGYYSPPGRLEVHPALEWKARIVLVKEVPEGALVGYGGSFRAPRPMRIGVLSVGYADGYPHRLSNKGKVIAAGKFAPLVGTVSMDLTTVDLSHAPLLAAGDAVTLLGREGDARLDAQQIARVAGTISYNVLCGISARVERVYV